MLTAFGHLDVLVNNAGVPLTCPAVEVTEAEWNAVIDVNLKGVFFTSQQMGRHLIASGHGGAIVSIASTHGVIGIADHSNYGISKAGAYYTVWRCNFRGDLRPALDNPGPAFRD